MRRSRAAWLACVACMHCCTDVLKEPISRQKRAFAVAYSASSASSTMPFSSSSSYSEVAESFVGRLLSSSPANSAPPNRACHKQTVRAHSSCSPTNAIVCSTKLRACRAASGLIATGAQQSSPSTIRVWHPNPPGVRANSSAVRIRLTAVRRPPLRGPIPQSSLQHVGTVRIQWKADRNLCAGRRNIPTTFPTRGSG